MNSARVFTFRGCAGWVGGGQAYAESKWYARNCSASNNTVCETCTSCPARTYEPTACRGGFSDSVCVPCTTCDAERGEWELVACTLRGDAVCETCVQCGRAFGTYTTVPCRPEHAPAGGAGHCSACRLLPEEEAACFGGELMWVDACREDYTGSCELCNYCDFAFAEGGFVTQLCGDYNNTVCAACSPACGAEQFEVSGCMPGHPHEALGADRVCADCKACGFDEWLLGNCSASADTVCVGCLGPCFVASNALSVQEFTKVACTADGPRQCEVCRQCQGGEYIASACNETHNTECGGCASCDLGVGEYYISFCGRYENAVCGQCAGCDSGVSQYYERECSLGNYSICRDCRSACFALRCHADADSRVGAV